MENIPTPNYLWLNLVKNCMIYVMHHTTIPEERGCKTYHFPFTISVLISNTFHRHYFLGNIPLLITKEGKKRDTKNIFLLVLLHMMYWVVHKKVSMQYRFE